jgi:hypothetical protein
MNTPHTPTPWTAQRDIRHTTNIGTPHDGSPKAWAIYGRYRVACIEESINAAWDDDREAEANANLIVQSVNAYHDLIAALQEISEAKGAYKRDPFEHAKSCVVDMQTIAIETLKKLGIEPIGEPVLSRES